MKKKILISLRTEVLLTIAFIIILTCTLLAFFFTKVYKETLENNLKNKTEIFARDLAICYGHYLSSTNQQKTLKHLVEKAMAEEDIISVQVYNKDFVALTVAKKEKPDTNKFIIDKKVEVDNINETFKAIHDFKGSRFFEIVSPIFRLNKIADLDEINSDQVKELVGAIRVVVSFAVIDKEVSQIKNIVIIISSGAIILGLCLSLLLIKIILNPIENLVEGVHKVSRGDLSFKVPDVKIKEIEYLIEKFNSMREVLDKTLKDLSNEKNKLFNAKIHLEELLNKMNVMQEKLLESEKFLTIGKLAAILSHKLKNPLTSLQNIMFYFSQVKDFSDEESTKMLKMFFEESSRSSRILSDLLDFSRLESIHKTSVYIDDIVHHATVEVCLPENIEIKKSFEHVEAAIDAFRLCQALEQLIINAKDSMKDGGIIYISVKRSDNFVEIKIKDTGSGIKKDDIENIWTPLFTTKLKSTGIGLAVVKKIVDLHSGSITVSSEENKGTELTINIPLAGGING
jgi:signal transduction histidine kinase